MFHFSSILPARNNIDRETPHGHRSRRRPANVVVRTDGCLEVCRHTHTLCHECVPERFVPCRRVFAVRTNGVRTYVRTAVGRGITPIHCVRLFVQTHTPTLLLSLTRLGSLSRSPLICSLGETLPGTPTIRSRCWYSTLDAPLDTLHQQTNTQTQTPTNKYTHTHTLSLHLTTTTTTTTTTTHYNNNNNHDNSINKFGCGGRGSQSVFVVVDQKDTCNHSFLSL